MSPECLWHRGLILYEMGPLLAETCADAVSIATQEIPTGTWYTDGSGPDKCQQANLPPYARKVGAASANIVFGPTSSVDQIGFHVGSVQGRQTVPRADLGAVANAASYNQRPVKSDF